MTTDEQWLRRFLRFHRPRHPRQMGGADTPTSPGSRW
ncbi:MAG: hypothetical protein ACK59A_14000 [Cyanobacteriota bacterium]